MWISQSIDTILLYVCDCQGMNVIRDRWAICTTLVAAIQQISEVTEASILLFHIYGWMNRDLILEIGELTVLAM